MHRERNASRTRSIADRQAVLDAARRLATASQREGSDLDEAIRVLRAIW
jgi:hypothetical protein